MNGLGAKIKDTLILTFNLQLPGFYFLDFASAVQTFA
jgi:hypothetical protein